MKPLYMHRLRQPELIWQDPQVAHDELEGQQVVHQDATLVTANPDRIVGVVYGEGEAAAAGHLLYVDERSGRRIDLRVALGDAVLAMKRHEIQQHNEAVHRWRQEDHPESAAMQPPLFPQES